MKKRLKKFTISKSEKIQCSQFVGRNKNVKRGKGLIKPERTQFQRTRLVGTYV